MELFALILSVATLAGLLVAGVFWRTYVPAYVAEKAKNLASKEDLAHLTGVVEAVKSLHAADIERLKASLATEAQVTERRRRIYEDICNALRVFIAGHENTEAIKLKFHAAYAAAWLWAADGVLTELNRYLVLQVGFTADRTAVDQAELKRAYIAVILAMRKDVGFPETAVPASEYQFVRFERGKDA